jgi:hypothetical protein
MELSPTTQGLAGGMSATYYFDSHIDYMGFRYGAGENDLFNGIFYFLVTAQFPD